MYINIHMENIEISINNDEEYNNHSINYEINESSPANVCIENTEIDDLLNSQDAEPNGELAKAVMHGIALGHAHFKRLKTI